MDGGRPPSNHPQPHAFLCALSPLPGGPPSEGLSADNQGTDSESRKKKSTQAPDRILIFWGGMSEAAAAGQESCRGGPASAAGEGRRGRGEEGRREPTLGAGEGGTSMVCSGPAEPEDQWNVVLPRKRSRHQIFPSLAQLSGLTCSD